MRATEQLDHPPHERRAATGGARRSAPMWLRAFAATVRLVVLSILGVIAAVLALAPLSARGGPSGRRVARLPVAHSPAAPAPGGLAEPFLDRRTGEGAGR